MKIIRQLFEYYWHEYQSVERFQALRDQSNWVDSIIHFIDYAFERQGSPRLYREYARKAFELKKDKLQSRSHWSDKLEEDIYAEFKKLCDSSELPVNEKLNPISSSSNHSQISLIKFAWYETEDQTITEWARNMIIEKQAIETAHEKLKKIRGVGPKIASFYLRDIYHAFECPQLSQEVVEEQGRCLQPIDVWIRRAAHSIKGDDSLTDRQCAETLLEFEQSNRLRLGEANTAFWILGSQILEERETFKQVVSNLSDLKTFNEQLQKKIRQEEDWLSFLRSLL